MCALDVHINSIVQIDKMCTLTRCAQETTLARAYDIFFARRIGNGNRKEPTRSVSKKNLFNVRSVSAQDVDVQGVNVRGVNVRSVRVVNVRMSGVSMSGCPGCQSPNLKESRCF